MTTPEDILSFWLGTVNDDGSVESEMQGRWFLRNDEFDRLIRDRFGTDVERALGGQLDSWLDSPRGRLALVILLDQFTRNIHRDSPRAYEGDLSAQEIVVTALDAGMDDGLAPIERAFLYMPLMHAESRELQRRGVECFAKLADSVSGPANALYAEFRHFAQLHADVVERFGRFPHRNQLHGRSSTAEEVAFLAEVPRGF